MSEHVGVDGCRFGWVAVFEESAQLVQCATLFCTYVEAALRATLARVTLARMSLALAVQMKGLGWAL
jgi:hypothetical protein